MSIVSVNQNGQFITKAVEGADLATDATAFNPSHIPVQTPNPYGDATNLQQVLDYINSGQVAGQTGARGSGITSVTQDPHDARKVSIAWADANGNPDAFHQTITLPAVPGRPGVQGYRGDGIDRIEQPASNKLKVKTTGTDDGAVAARDFEFELPKGDQGEKGQGVDRIEKSGDWMEIYYDKTAPDGSQAKDIIALPKGDPDAGIQAITYDNVTGQLTVTGTDPSLDIAANIKGTGIQQIVAMSDGSADFQMTDGTSQNIPLPKGDKGIGINEVVQDIDDIVLKMDGSLADGTTEVRVTNVRGAKGDLGLTGERGSYGPGITQIVFDDSNADDTNSGELEITWQDGNQILQPTADVSVTRFEDTAEVRFDYLPRIKMYGVTSVDTGTEVIYDFTQDPNSTFVEIRETSTLTSYALDFKQL